jgi:hypothetical protein
VQHNIIGVGQLVWNSSVQALGLVEFRSPVFFVFHGVVELRLHLGIEPVGRLSINAGLPFKRLHAELRRYWQLKREINQTDTTTLNRLRTRKR